VAGAKERPRRAARRSPPVAPGIDTLATLLRRCGYHVAIKGKWHLSKPVDGESWGAADPARVERDYGFAEWEPPDAGGDTKAENFGGGNAGVTHRGWDEDYTRQMEVWLARMDLREPFCLVFSLVNPHDVLGYPASYLRGGYAPGEFRGLGVPLPPTIEEDLREKRPKACTAKGRPYRDRPNPKGPRAVPTAIRVSRREPTLRWHD
jgi:choline-sulfatase